LGMICTRITRSEFPSAPVHGEHRARELTASRQSRDDADHNLVTVVMKEKGLSLQETYDWIGRLHDDVADEFLRLYKDLPSFPDESEQVNREIREYAYGLGNWVRTNERWSFEVSSVVVAVKLWC
jgi:hypothetical protein